MSLIIEAFDTARPDDVSGLARIIASVGAADIRRLVVFVKVEGDYDDGSRERARAALEELMRDTGLGDRAQLLTAVGCEGVATPFGYALIDVAHRSGDPAATDGAPRLTVGCAASAPVASLKDNDDAIIALVAQTVRAATADAALQAAEVVMAFVKVPQPAGSADPGERVRGRRARGLAALGTGVALGEIAPGSFTPAAVTTDLRLYCSRVQAFGGPEVTRVEVIVLGNRTGAGGNLMVHAGLAHDLIDSTSLKRMLLRAGLPLDAEGQLGDVGRVAAFFLKAGPNADGSVRGARTTIFGSSIPPEKHMRAAVSGLVGGLLGTTRAFTTGDPIHQGPEGGGVACAIVRVG